MKNQALNIAKQAGMAYEVAVARAGLSAVNRKPISLKEAEARKNKRQSVRTARRANRR
ncbi:hypothetical protein PAECIP111891_04237 [Paenibacillus allorhizoplanae]|uniref:Small, acid-soluble spore protein, alpha/beta type n=1 Tax=Paenibacillus allorhizoplanae TaxID=2905648 RepID=A0ABN8GUF8_9BACL|nr:hypothetical protein [Paenibacillus allorhizoplanae]CAH1215244.1 hypothetical protein PAECIP111891_04237 [Paenibacillus allorhizoplanae]